MQTSRFVLLGHEVSYLVRSFEFSLRSPYQKDDEYPKRNGRFPLPRDFPNAEVLGEREEKRPREPAVDIADAADDCRDDSRKKPLEPHDGLNPRVKPDEKPGDPSDGAREEKSLPIIRSVSMPTIFA